MSLENHSRQYSISLNDALLSVVTGLSGAPYAQRHWELSNKPECTCVWGHRTLAALEAIPVIGGLAALIERIVSWANTTFFANASPPPAPTAIDTPKSLKDRVSTLDENEKLPLKSFAWKPRALAIDVAAKKMWKNAEKAIDEHAAKFPGSYPATDKALPQLEAILNPKPSTPLKFNYCAADAQGIRPSMEDTHFFKEFEKGAFTAVFDGHGGREIAEFASDTFQKKFPEALDKANGNVHQAMEKLIDEIYQEVVAHKEWNQIGSTAVISFIDKNTRQIYTATIGDSEANIYRKIDGNLQSIPLSCVRDWSSESDAERASIALGDPNIATEWPKIKDGKIRFPSPFYGVNVSRSIGDCFLAGTKEKPGVIHKPKITMNQLQPGDLLVLACDGLKDYVSEKEIIQNIEIAKSENLLSKIITFFTGRNSASRLVDYAINHNHSTDNVTVLAIEVT